ncbi:hypothetical protein U0023_29470 (plasmid) [Microvirga lotononidis]|nr:hypothetical protein [Microvirga lotononidis]WQO30390.1 hypothetical protein U0023_29470 [Microvirga lotononidis]
MALDNFPDLALIPDVDGPPMIDVSVAAGTIPTIGAMRLESLVARSRGALLGSLASNEKRFLA